MSLLDKILDKPRRDATRRWQSAVTVIPPVHAEVVLETGEWQVIGERQGTSGQYLFPLETPRVAPHAAGVLHITAAEGYVNQDVPVEDIGPPNTQFANVILEPWIVSLPRLVADGAFFRLATGERWTGIQCSDFNLLGRYILEGPDAIKPVLAERQAIGFNLLRVWTRYEGGTGPNAANFEAQIGRLLPSEHPEVYEKLPAFCALCASYGLYIEFTAYTGGSREDHWDRLATGLQGVSNVLVELINENNAYSHDIHVDEFSPIPGIICSHGSNGSQSLPVRPWWDYETAHFNDAYEFARKVGHNSMEYSEGTDGIPASRVPILANENTRPDRDGNIDHFYDAAAGAALLVAGSCFHSQSGKRSALFTDEDRPFAEAWVTGAKSVDLEFQHGNYRHDPAWEGPNDLRTYRRYLDDGRYFEVVIRR